MSGMFGGGGAQGPQQEVYAGMQVSTSLYGMPIPYVAGRQRLPLNLLWYGNFTVSANGGGSKGGGGSSTKQNSYAAAWIGGICLGPIQGVTQVWHDKALVTLAYENLALSEGGAAFIGSISGSLLTVTRMLGGFIAVNAVMKGAAGSISSYGTGTGGVGTYNLSVSQTVASTTLRTSQPVWTGYPTGTPATQKIPYDSQAYVAASAYNLGSSAALPNLNFEIEGVVASYSVANSIYDADPSAVWLDYLLDAVHGALANYPGTPLIIGSYQAPLQGVTNSYQAWCLAMGLLTSPYEKTQRQSTDFLSELLDCTASTCRLSVGVLELLPFCDQAVSATVAGTTFSYTPNLTPQYIFTDDDYCPQKDEPPVELQITPQADTYNMVPIQYNDRSNYYNQAPVMATDLNDIVLYGPRLASQMSWNQITQSTVALMAGQLWLNRQLREINRYQFRTLPIYGLLEPGDYVGMNDITLGLVNQVCQIEQMEKDANGNLQFTVVELPGVTRTLAQYNWNAAQGYFDNYAADPGAVQGPDIFVMPPLPAVATAGITVGVAVCGQTSNAAWLGCDVYCSADGGTTYDLVGIVPGACQYGTLTAGLAAVVDPDTTSTLQIALSNTNLQLSTSATHADADTCKTLMVLFGNTGPEVIAYGTAVLTSAGHYNLTYLRRNLYGSTNQTVNSGNGFVRLNDNLLSLGFDPGQAGQTVYFKFVSFNKYRQYGNQTLAGATAYPYTIPALAVGGAARLVPRGNAVWDGHNAYKMVGVANGWDSDVVSSASFVSGNISAQYATGGALAVGFMTSTGATANPNSNMYGIYAHADSAVTVVVENGAVAYTAASPVPGDLYDVRSDGAAISYYINGVLVHQTPQQGGVYYFAMGFFEGACQFSNVTTQSGNTTYPTIWKAGSACWTTDDHAQKAGGTAGWNAGSFAATLFGFGACHVRAKATNGSLNELMFGLATSQNVAAATSYTGSTIDALINYAWYVPGTAVGGSGLWTIYESGTSITTLGVASSTDVAWITYDGANVRYYLNDSTTPVRTVAASGVLYGLATFYDVGAAISSLDFGPTTNLALADTGQLGLNAATNLSFIVDDATYATTWAGTPISTTWPGAAFAVPYASSPVLNFTGTITQDVIITATGTIYFNNTSPATTISAAWIGVALIDTTNPAANVLIDYSPQAGHVRGFNNISAGASVTTSPSPTQQFAFQMEEAVTVGHTYVVVVFIQTTSPQVTAETTSVQLQVETIKR